MAAVADCVCLFLVRPGQFKNSEPAVFRTAPISFAEASGVANRLAGTCETIVYAVTDSILDRYCEAPAAMEMVSALLKRPVKRLDLVLYLSRRVHLN